MLCSLRGCGVLDAFENELTSEFVCQGQQVGDDLHLRRVSFEGRSEMLTDLQERWTDAVDEWQMRIGDAHIVECEPDAQLSERRDALENRAMVREGSLLRDFDDDAMQ